LAPDAKQMSRKGEGFRERLLVLAAEHEALLCRCATLEEQNSHLIARLSPHWTVSNHAPGLPAVRKLGSEAESADEPIHCIPSMESSAQCTTHLSSDVCPRIREFWRERKEEQIDVTISPRTSGALTLDWESVSTLGNQPRWVLHPDSRIRTCFDVSSIIVLVHDSVIVPYLIAWEPPTTTLLRVISLCTLVFWFFDMSLNFCTGYATDGDVEMRFRFIVKNYLRTWFPCDAFVNGVDLATVLMENFVAGGDIKVLRILRLLKMNRMLRILILFKRFRNMGSQALSTSLRFFFQVTKIIIMVLWMNHIISCIWFKLGQLPMDVSDTGRSWLDLAPTSGGDPYRNAGTLFQYCTALHWALTQMSPGSMSVVPQNSVERCFNIFCLIVGLLVGAMLISQLTASLVQWRMATQEQIARMNLLRQFLRENQIALILSNRVLRQVKERSASQKRLTEKDVPALSLLSANLRRELRYNAFGEKLNSHALLASWAWVDGPVHRALCFKAVQLSCLTPGEDLFTSQSPADSLYLVLDGVLTYDKDVEDVQVSSTMDEGGELASPTNLSEEYLKRIVNGVDHSEKVCADTWVSEVALWLNWTYMGTLEAGTPCELLAIHVPKLIDVFRQRGHPALAALNVQYCAAFCEQVMNEKEGGHPDLGVDHLLVLLSMQAAPRKLIMQPLLHQLKLNTWSRALFSGKGMQELEKELEAGTCVLCPAAGQKIVRAVLLVVLRVSRPDGRILVQIAKDKDGKLQPSVALPGTKVKAGEHSKQALKRILMSDLAPFNKSIIVGRREKSEDLANSASYGLPTKYMKTIFDAKLVRDPSIEKPSLRGPPFDFDTIKVGDKDGKSVLYAWVPPEDVDGLKTSRGYEHIRKLLQDIFIAPSSPRTGSSANSSRSASPSHKERKDAKRRTAPEVKNIVPEHVDYETWSSSLVPLAMRDISSV